jgi:hypothetical protein
MGEKCPRCGAEKLPGKALHGSVVYSCYTSIGENKEEFISTTCFMRREKQLEEEILSLKRWKETYFYMRIYDRKELMEQELLSENERMDRLISKTWYAKHKDGIEERLKRKMKGN